MYKSHIFRMEGMSPQASFIPCRRTLGRMSPVMSRGSALVRNRVAPVKVSNPTRPSYSAVFLKEKNEEDTFSFLQYTGGNSPPAVRVPLSRSAHSLIISLSIPISATVPKHREPPKSPFQSQIELDKFSNLPVHVIDQILSQLSIRDAVRTSVLSTKWRYRWSTLPNLVFDNQCLTFNSQDQNVIKNKLVNVIDHVLLLHTGPIYKFKLSHRDLIGITDIDKWILHVSRSSIREFVLEIWKGQRYKLCSHLFSCQHLIHLELFNCLVNPPPTFQGFKNLKSLDLQHVTMTQEVFETLISSCSLLERLTLMNFDGFTHLNIDAPKLLFFDIGGYFDDITFTNTLSLALISIGMYADEKLERRPIRNANNLVKFFSCLPHIRRLEIQNCFLKFLASGDIPGRLCHPCADLGYLSIRINLGNFAEISAVLCLLRSSPNLQEFEIVARPEEHSPGESCMGLWEGEQQFCSFPQLRLVKISNISGSKPELELISFILLASPALEKMMIKPALVNEGMEMMKELLRFRRASVRAEVIYVDP